MALERQTSWGRLIAFAIFLEGTGAGVFSVSFVLGFIGGLKQPSSASNPATAI